MVVLMEVRNFHHLQLSRSSRWHRQRHEHRYPCDVVSGEGPSCRCGGITRQLRAGSTMTRSSRSNSTPPGRLRASAGSISSLAVAEGRGRPAAPRNGTQNVERIRQRTKGIANVVDCTSQGCRTAWNRR